MKSFMSSLPHVRLLGTSLAGWWTGRHGRRRHPPAPAAGQSLLLQRQLQLRQLFQLWILKL